MITVLENKNRRVDAAFMVDGVKVTICKPGPVRKTWKPVRGSVYNMGAKAASLAGCGINARKG